MWCHHQCASQIRNHNPYPDDSHPDDGGNGRDDLSPRSEPGSLWQCFTCVSSVILRRDRTNGRLLLFPRFTDEDQGGRNVPSASKSQGEPGLRCSTVSLPGDPGGLPQRHPQGSTSYSNSRPCTATFTFCLLKGKLHIRVCGSSEGSYRHLPESLPHSKDSAYVFLMPSSPSSRGL